MTPETPLAQRALAARDAAPTSETARRLLEIDAVEIARAYLDAVAEVERLRAIVEAVADADGDDTIGSIKVDVPGRPRAYLGYAAREALK